MLGSPASQAVARATYAAHLIAGIQRPGADHDDFSRRIGSVTSCEKTRGQAVRNVNGQEVQLDADECVSGSVLAEPGPGGRGGGTFQAMEKAGERGIMDHDGTRRYSGLRVVPMATPGQTEVAARWKAAQDEAQDALAALARVQDRERLTPDR